MFLETSNGYLINTNEIITIYITISCEKDPLCAVKAKTKIGNEISLYRDRELQYCQEYMDKLKEKIAIKMR